MNIWNKVLVGLIAVASIGFFYLGARTLKTDTYWRNLAAAQEARISQMAAENQELRDGVEREGQPPVLGLRALKVKLYKLLVDRRRAWFNCGTRVKKADGSVEAVLTIDKPAPHGIVKQTVLYAFEDADAKQKGRYLGEFVVTDVADKQITLKPAAEPTPRELDKIAASKGPWTVYEIMPQDNREIFASFSDAEKKAILPAGSVAEYIKDGKPAAKDDPKEFVVNGKYVRPLRDYEVLFHAEQEKRILLIDSIDAATRDKKLVQDALASAQVQVAACAKDITATKAELAKFEAQRKLVSDYLAKFQTTLDQVRAAVRQLIQDNQAKAGQIAEYQLKAAEQIDRRTRAMARSGAERL
jgi:hypothetical protein